MKVKVSKWDPKINPVQNLSLDPKRSLGVFPDTPRVTKQGGAGHLNDKFGHRPWVLLMAKRYRHTLTLTHSHQMPRHIRHICIKLEG